MKFNKNNIDYYKFKFGRVPKTHTIESLHDLYLKALERNNAKLKLLTNCILRAVDEVSEFEKGIRKIYFSRGNKIYQHVLSYDSSRSNYGWNGWSVRGAELLNSKSNSVVMDRNEKLEFILSNEKAFELGELYHSLKGNSRHLQQLVWGALSVMVADKLNVDFKGKLAPENIIISIGDKEYYVHCDPQFRYDKFWKKFELKGELEKIKL